MKKATKLLTGSLIFLLTACGNPSNPNTGSSASASPSSQPSVAATSSTQPSVSPSSQPSASSSPVTTSKNKYNLPLKVYNAAECVPTEKAEKLVYEISDSGLFTYNLNTDQFGDNTESVLLTHQLESKELPEWEKNLTESKLAELAKGDQAIPDGSPQTEECRSVQFIKFKVDGTEMSFNFNSRKFTHTDEYRKSFVAFREKLDALKTKVKPQDASLNTSFSLKVGQMVRFPAEKMELKLISFNDSRCPAGVQCVWAGELAFNFSFKADGLPPESFSLAQRGEDNSTTTKKVGNYQINLEKVVGTSDYQVIMKVSK